MECCPVCGKPYRPANQTLMGYPVYFVECGCHPSPAVASRITVKAIGLDLADVEDEVRRDYFTGRLTREQYRRALCDLKQEKYERERTRLN